MIVIELPLPHKALSPNARVHWRVKAKHTKAYRGTARLMAQVRSDAKGWPSAAIECHFYFKQNRRRDRDNLLASMKAAFDGLADGGLVVNDANFTHLPPVIAVDKARPRVELHIREVA